MIKHIVETYNSNQLALDHKEQKVRWGICPFDGSIHENDNLSLTVLKTHRSGTQISVKIGVEKLKYFLGLEFENKQFVVATDPKKTKSNKKAHDAFIKTHQQVFHNTNIAPIIQDFINNKNLIINNINNLLKNGNIKYTQGTWFFFCDKNGKPLDCLYRTNTRGESPASLAEKALHTSSTGCNDGICSVTGNNGPMVEKGNKIMWDGKDCSINTINEAQYGNDLYSVTSAKTDNVPLGQETMSKLVAQLEQIKNNNVPYSGVIKNFSNYSDLIYVTPLETRSKLQQLLEANKDQQKGSLIENLLQYIDGIGNTKQIYPKLPDIPNAGIVYQAEVVRHGQRLELGPAKKQTWEKINERSQQAQMFFQNEKGNLNNIFFRVFGKDNTVTIAVKQHILQGTPISDKVKKLNIQKIIENPTSQLTVKIANYLGEKNMNNETLTNYERLGAIHALSSELQRIHHNQKDIQSMSLSLKTATIISNPETIIQSIQEGHKYYSILRNNKKSNYQRINKIYGMLNRYIKALEKIDFQTPPTTQEQLEIARGFAIQYQRERDSTNNH